MDREQLRRKVHEHRERLERTVSVNGKVITINIAFEYHIPPERCDTLEKSLGYSPLWKKLG